MSLDHHVLGRAAAGEISPQIDAGTAPAALWALPVRQVTPAAETLREAPVHSLSLWRMALRPR